VTIRSSRQTFIVETGERYVPRRAAGVLLIVIVIVIVIAIVAAVIAAIAWALK
jgi:hypothetical protein